MFLIFCLILISGCAVTITYESAKAAVNDARFAIENAKRSGVDIKSSDNIVKAEKLLNEAEYALTRNRRQRAYTYANRAAEMARLSQEDIEEPLPATSGKKVYDLAAPSTDTYYERGQTAAKPLPEDETSVRDIITKASDTKPKIQPQELFQSAPMETQDLQSQIKAAMQALYEAEKAVQAAKLLMLKSHAEVGISSSDNVVQQLKQNEAPSDVVNMVQSRYDQARKAISLGQYEQAVALIEQAQTYAQAFLKPIRQRE